MNTDQITPVILTFNEAPNLKRTLEKLCWAREIALVDSFSADETLEIARSFSNVRVIQRKFDDHTSQWNFAVQQARSPWILALDADYVAPVHFAEELQRLQGEDCCAAYFARFRYCVFGYPLRATLYPPRAVLFRRDRCIYVQDGHTQRLQIDGESQFLESVIDHDDRKPLPHWLRSQDRYALLEAAKLAEAPPGSLRFQDRLRLKMVFAPIVVFCYTLLGKGLILDGRPGWFYVFQRTLAELILSLHLLEAKFKLKLPPPEPLLKP